MAWVKSEVFNNLQNNRRSGMLWISLGNLISEGHHCYREGAQLRYQWIALIIQRYLECTERHLSRSRPGASKYGYFLSVIIRIILHIFSDPPFHSIRNYSILEAGVHINSLSQFR